MGNPMESQFVVVVRKHKSVYGFKKATLKEAKDIFQNIVHCTYPRRCSRETQFRERKVVFQSSGDMIDGYYYNDQDYYEFENDENENEAEEIESPFDDYMIFTIKKNIMKAYKVLYV
ncbi:4564_t:CDS:2 [Rhizophagus irregularis]|nr:4564_t:CDS:2 [Rhizophagus irregularis]